MEESPAPAASPQPATVGASKIARTRNSTSGAVLTAVINRIADNGRSPPGRRTWIIHPTPLGSEDLGVVPKNLTVAVEGPVPAPPELQTGNPWYPPCR